MSFSLIICQKTNSIKLKDEQTIVRIKVLLIRKLICRLILYYNEQKIKNNTSRLFLINKNNWSQKKKKKVKVP